jgi:uncharacterized protein (TIGR03437 family)
MKTASCRTFAFLLLSTMGAWAQQAPIMGVNAAIGSPAAIAADASGNVYFVSSNNNRLFKVDQDGILTTVAGGSVAGFSGDGGPAVSAELNGPTGLALDSAGNLYIADSGNGRVRRVSSSGIITTVAGNGSGVYPGDGGPATDAGISPAGLAIDGSGNLYIYDEQSAAPPAYSAVVRKVSLATGIITTAAGGCLPQACASFYNSGLSATEIGLWGSAIAADQSGNLYVVSNLSFDDPSVSYIYEFSGGVFVNDFSGILGPANVAVDHAGNLYMVDGGCQVDEVYITGYVNPSYELKLVAGNGQCGYSGSFDYSGDGGPAVDAGISPAAIAFDGNGNMYIADSGNQRIRKVSSDSGIITTIAGGAYEGIAAVVSGASFQPIVAPNSWITIEGTNLSPVTDTWASAIVDGNLPTSLDGVSVSVAGQPAYVEYISPNQINVVAPNFSTVPPSVGTEWINVTVTNASGNSSSATFLTQTTQPAFFQWGNYAVATHQDYSLAAKNGTFAGLTTAPAAPGEVIILWGTGFGPTMPSAPVGVEVPSSITYNTASPVIVTVGTAAGVVYGAALALGYAGLYQVAIQIPPSLANGDYPVVATVDGAQSPGGVLITVQQ